MKKLILLLILAGCSQNTNCPECDGKGWYVKCEKNACYWEKCSRGCEGRR